MASGLECLFYCDAPACKDKNPTLGAAKKYTLKPPQVSVLTSPENITQNQAAHHPGGLGD